MKRIQIKRRIAEIKRVRRQLQFAEFKLDDMTSSKFWFDTVTELKAKLNALNKGA